MRIVKWKIDSVEICQKSPQRDTQLLNMKEIKSKKIGSNNIKCISNCCSGRKGKRKGSPILGPIN